ncbi:Uncharacterised protein [Mycobacteroides abscessus subsp. abscessus]|nr:Uncharacterised protein [Mycobacteroides abscessus subsp. abscessus]
MATTLGSYRPYPSAATAAFDATCDRIVDGGEIHRPAFITHERSSLAAHHIRCESVCATTPYAASLEPPWGDALPFARIGERHHRWDAARFD